MSKCKAVLDQEKIKMITVRTKHPTTQANPPENVNSSESQRIVKPVKGRT